MNTNDPKDFQSRFFTGHYSMAEINSICRSGMGSIRVAKNGSPRRKSLHQNLECFSSLETRGVRSG